MRGRPSAPGAAGRGASEAERGVGPLPPACTPAPGGGCSICGDEGWEAEVVELVDGGRGARVRSVERPGPGEERRIALDLVEDVAAGDRVIVHLGFAIAAVREDAPGAGRDGAPGARRDRKNAVAPEGGPP